MRSFVFGFFLIVLTLKTEARPAYCQFLAKFKTKKITVAVIDTGIDVNHSALREKIWKNSKEIPSNKIDDDHNGYIDDIHGWNFAAHNADLHDSTGHGTHIAGLVLGIQKTQEDFLQPLQVMVLKYFENGMRPRDTAEAFAKAFEYALNMNAEVIQISGGGYAFSLKEKELFQKAEKKGVLIIAANGNKIKGQKDRPFFPASYKLKNIFSVIATDVAQKPLATSNLYSSPHLFFEVGQSLVSTLPQNNYGPKTGSSQAAGLFTGNLLRNRHTLCSELVANSQ